MDELAYVVNIESAVNLDIDFHKDVDYPKAFYLEYTYTEDGMYETGKAYRVRLKGIAIRRDIANKNKRLLNQAVIDLRNFINRCGGFLKYQIDGIDVFNRIIATFYDPITNECMNDILLQPKYSPVFKIYRKFN